MIELFILLSLLGGSMGHNDIKFAVTDGRVRTKFFNYGGICGPDRVNPWPRLEWPAGSGHEYLYEAGLLIGARVKAYDPSTHDSTWIWIIDDGIQDGGDTDFEPAGGYANPNNDTFAITTNRFTWPSVWAPYVTILGDSIVRLTNHWPGEFWSGREIVDTTKGQESFWVMSDSANTEFMPGNSYNNPYYDPGNGMKGLGIIVYGRSYTITIPTPLGDAVNDLVIFDYTLINAGNKTLDSIIVGFYTDMDIGRPASDFSDDMYELKRNLNTVRFYDQDGYGRDAQGRPYRCGQVAQIFLQTPGNSSDGIDNDRDGVIDESPSDGIDNDGDWDPIIDDVGRDGLSGTHDYGEGDGVPTLGEPNFEWRDPDEIDELGLTSANNFHYGTVFPGNDPAVGELMRPGQFNIAPGPGDFVTISSAGFFSLHPQERQRFVIAFVFDPHWNDTGAIYSRVRKVQLMYHDFIGTGIFPTFFQVTFSHPYYGEVVNGDYQVEWSPHIVRPFIYELLVTPNNGLTYYTVISNYQVQGSQYLWHTNSWPDGSLYRLKISLSDNQGIGYGTSDLFVLDNPGINGKASGVILTDNILNPIIDTLNLTLLSGDPEGDTYELKLLLSLDNQRTWETLVDTNLSNRLDTLIFSFNSREFPNTDSAYFAVVCNTQGEEDTTQIAGPYKIHNFRHYQSGDSAVVHIAGFGDGNIVLCKMGNPTTTDTFRLTFNSQNGDILYSLFNLNSGEYVFRNYPLIPGLESPDFGNMRLLISTVNDTVPDDSFNTHIAGNSNFYVQCRHNRHFERVPHDYVIHFYNSLVGYAMYNGIRDTISVNFIVKDTTTNSVIIPVFFDGDHDGVIASPDGRDAIYVVYSQNGQFIAPWILTFWGPSNDPIPPSGGDVYYIKILSPFSESDTFLIYSSRVTGVREENQIEDFKVFVPSIVTKSMGLAINVKNGGTLELKIFDIAGRMVMRRKFENLGAGIYTFNIPVSKLKSGIYFVQFRLRGKKISKKFMVIR